MLPGYTKKYFWDQSYFVITLQKSFINLTMLTWRQNFRKSIKQERTEIVRELLLVQFFPLWIYDKMYDFLYTAPCSWLYVCIYMCVIKLTNDYIKYQYVTQNNIFYYRYITKHQRFSDNK
jgi:hypothetical protein